MKKIISFIATSAILLNSFYAPLTAIAQEMTPTPEPTPEATSTPDPSPEITPSPTEDPTPAPSETPADLATPSAEPTFIPEEISTPVPTDQVIQTQAPESIPTTPGPPTETSTPETSDTPTPMFTPVIADENAEVTTQVVTKELFPETVQENSVVKLITDKLDYTPSEIAIITGTGFAPDKPYSLTVSSSDDPATTTTVDVTASGDGEFTYEYQLDGKYRPNYLVEVKDGRELVATTTFTDSYPSDTLTLPPLSNASCMQTVYTNAGNNQTLGCVANDGGLSSANIIAVLDDGCQSIGDTVTFTATYELQSTASERYDVGIYFATDGDPNNDGALTGTCTIGTLPYAPVPPWYDLDGGDFCGDITSSGPLNPEFTITAQCIDNNNDNLLDLPYCTSYDNNTAGSCTNPLQAIPGTSSKCSCGTLGSIGITVPFSAEIEVVKNLIPSTDPGKFDLQIDDITQKANAVNGDSTNKVSVSAGTSDNPGATHTVGEIAGIGTSMSDYRSSISCEKRGTSIVVASGSGTGPLDVTVQKDDDIVCTITNTVNNGTLTVIKHVDNNYGGTKVASDFTINVTGGTPSSFSGSESGTSVTVPANGIYSVSETPVAGYSASYSTDCSGTMPPGGNKTCTITNTDIQPKLTITKVVINDNGGTKLVADFPLFVGSTQVASGIQNSFNAGTYIVSETQQTGYTMTGITGNCASNGSITLAPGDVKSCTITNNDNIPALHLRKTITNDNGGTVLATAWTLSATGTAVSPTNLSGSTPVDSGALFKTDTYTLAEIGGPSGYSAGTWDCGGAQMPDPTHVVVPLGANVTCTINNNDIPPSLTLNKILSKTHGGNETEASWTLTADGGTAGILSGPGAAGSIDVVSDTTFKAGTYTLSELGSTGYSPSSWSCTGSGSQIGNQITLSIGQSAVCSITNSDVAPTITLIKSVQNLFGGTAGINDFGLTIGGTSVTSGQVLSVNSNTSYSLNEAGLSGYEFVSLTGTLCPISLGGTITLNEGGSIVCTITNRDIQPKLTVIKHVISDNGGNNTAGDFTMNVSGINVSTSSFNGSETGTLVTLNAGGYSVSESAVSGYSQSTSGDCSGTIAVGETKTCTITNDDVAPTLTLVKQVTNDNGGTSPASAWTLSAIGTGGISGTGTVGPSSVKANVAYTLSESGPAGYTAGTWNCVGGTMGASAPTITLTEGQSAICTIINDDNSPSLKLVKSIDYGPKLAGDWDLSAMTTGGGFVDAGDSTKFHTVLANTAYTLGESTVEGYTQEGGWTCDKGSLEGSVLTLSLTDQETTCTITNHRDMGSVKVHKNVDINGDGDWTDENETSDIYANGNGFSWNFYGGQRDYGVLMTGIPTTTAYATYPISENMPDDYHFVSWFNNNDREASCTNPTGIIIPSTIQITKDSLTEITLCNGRDVGTVTIDKVTIPSEATDEFIINLNQGPTERESTIIHSSTLSDQDTPDTFIVPVGSYWLEELENSDWELTDVSCTDGEVTFDGQADGFQVMLGRHITCTFTNTLNIPSVSIEKTNNRGSGIRAGVDVTYTLTVTNTGNIALSDFTVQDILPAGFSYVSGSTNGAVTNDPSIFGSTLSWEVPGVLNPEASLTITYRANTDSSLSDGVYTNFATCQAFYGQVFEVDSLLLQRETRNSISCNTDSSTVTIGSTLGYGGSLGGQVLGASTELPATGNPTWLLLAALGLTGTGIYLNIRSKKQYKYAKN